VRRHTPSAGSPHDVVEGSPVITFIGAVVGILWIVAIWGAIPTDKHGRPDR